MWQELGLVRLDEEHLLFAAPDPIQIGALAEVDRRKIKGVVKPR